MKTKTTPFDSLLDKRNINLGPMNEEMMLKVNQVYMDKGIKSIEAVTGYDLVDFIILSDDDFEQTLACLEEACVALALGLTA